MSAWTEGRHGQLDVWRVSTWVGIAWDRWMLGLVLNVEARSLGFGFGPFYFGVGVVA